MQSIIPKALLGCLSCVQERALRVCTYSGSSSDTETEPDGTGSSLGSQQRTLVNRIKKSDSGLAKNIKAPSVICGFVRNS